MDAHAQIREDNRTARWIKDAIESGDIVIDPLILSVSLTPESITSEGASTVWTRLAR